MCFLQFIFHLQNKLLKICIFLYIIERLSQDKYGELDPRICIVFVSKTCAFTLHPKSRKLLSKIENVNSFY